MGDDAFVLALVQRPGRMTIGIYGEQGRCACSFSREFAADEGTGVPNVLDPDELLTSAITLMESAIRRAGISSRQVRCMGIGASSHQIVVWDSVSGKPYGSFYMPTDWTTISATARVSWIRARLSDLTQELDVGQTWRHLRIGGVDSWLVWNLAHDARFVMYAGHDLALLRDDSGPISEMNWLQECGVEVCPELACNLQQVAVISPVYLDGARIPITAMCCSQTAALYGAGLRDPGEVFIDYDHDGSVVLWGTSGANFAYDGVRIPAWVRVVPSSCSVSSHASVVGHFSVPQMTLRWLDTLLLRQPELADVVRSLREYGSLFITPYGNGGKSTILGVEPTTQPAAIYAATLRALAFMVSEALEVVETKGRSVSALHADDSLFGIPAVFSFQAAVIQKPLFAHKGDSHCLGMAILAGLGVGLWSTEDVIRTVLPSLSCERYDPAEPDRRLTEERSEWQAWAQRLKG